MDKIAQEEGKLHIRNIQNNKDILYDKLSKIKAVSTFSWSLYGAKIAIGTNKGELTILDISDFLKTTNPSLRERELGIKNTLKQKQQQPKKNERETTTSRKVKQKLNFD